MGNALETEFNYYLEHQDELVRLYNGRFIVLKGHEVLGVYDERMEALNETAKEHEPGTFMVHRVTPGDAGHTVTLYSPLKIS